MKKVVFSVSFFLLLFSASIAQNGKYQIFTENKSWFGLGEKTIIMLDRESGHSWILANNKWVALAGITEESSLKNEENANAQLMAKFEEELAQLRARQAKELDAMRLKQSEEIKAITDKIDTLKSGGVKQAKNIRNTRRSSATKQKARPATPKESPQRGEDEDNAPPDWLK